jgi:hypothetical protein
MKKIMILLAMLALTIGLVGAPAQAAPTASVVAVDSVTGQVTEMMRQQSCPNNQVCFYGCLLSGSCGYWFTIASTKTSCTNIYAKHVDIQSVRNETGYNFRVWHNSSCSNVGSPPTSVLYAESDGNMNTEWKFDGIGSAQRLLT